MYDKGIFVFGSKIFPQTKQDAISSLPLELSWKIFSYLDDISLRIATRTYKLWQRIILSCRKLRRRLSKFDFTMTLGSESLVKFYKKRRKICRKEARINYLPLGQSTDQTMKTTAIKSKRSGDHIIVYTKRFKLY